MTENTTTTPTLSPREADALAAYRQWEANGKQGSYAEYVRQTMPAKTNGEQVTVGRAGVYVREALAKIGEAPDGGRRGGGGRKSRQPRTKDAVLAAALATFDAQLESLQGRIATAAEEAEQFDAEKFIEQRTEMLSTKAKEAAAAAKAWKADEAAQQEFAQAEAARLQDRIEKVRAEVEAELEFAQGERDDLAEMIAKAAGNAS